MRKSIETDIRPCVFSPPTSDRGRGRIGIGIGAAVVIEVGYCEYWQNCRETESDCDPDTDSETDNAFPAALSGSQPKATGFVPVDIYLNGQMRLVPRMRNRASNPGSSRSLSEY